MRDYESEYFELLDTIGGPQIYTPKQNIETIKRIVAISYPKAELEIKDLKDKLHRRNMQIKDLKEQTKGHQALIEACKSTLTAIEGADDYLERQVEDALNEAGA